MKPYDHGVFEAPTPVPFESLTPYTTLRENRIMATSKRRFSRNPNTEPPGHDLAEHEPYARDGHDSARHRRHSLDPFHVDDQILVFNKPAGFPISVDRTGLTTFPEFQDQTLRDIGPLYEVVPIDQGAGGIALFARTRPAQQALADQRSDRRLEICYVALVRAQFVEQSGTIDLPLGRGRRPPHAMRVDPEKGRPAVTEWRLRDSFVGYALLECRPRTAASDQIRVHLAGAGMPLAVDREYGAAESLFLSSFKVGYRPSRRRPEKPLIERPSLHAEFLSFRHPVSDEPMRFEAPMPKDFRAAINQLHRFGRLPPK